MMLPTKTTKAAAPIAIPAMAPADKLDPPESLDAVTGAELDIGVDDALLAVSVGNPWPGDNWVVAFSVYSICTLNVSVLLALITPII